MKKLKKALSVLLVGAISVTSLVCGSITAGAANAKNLVAKALKEMQNAKTISCSYEAVITHSEKDTLPTRYIHGMCSSDSKINYAMYIGHL